MFTSFDMQTLGILPNLAEGISQQDHVYTLKVQITTEIMSASNRRQVRCLINQSDGTLNVGSARDSQGNDKIVEPEIITKSVASLPTPTVPVFDVAPFNVVAPETIRNRAIDSDGVRAVRLQRHVAT